MRRTQDTEKWKLTHEWGKTFDVDFFGHDKAAAALFSGRLSDDRNGVLWRLIWTEAPCGTRWDGIWMIEGYIVAFWRRLLEPLLIEGRVGADDDDGRWRQAVG